MLVSSIIGNLNVDLTGDGGAPDTLLNDIVSFWALDESSGSRADSAGSNTMAEVNGPIGTTTIGGETAAGWTHP